MFYIGFKRQYKEGTWKLISKWKLKSAEPTDSTMKCNQDTEVGET